MMLQGLHSNIPQPLTLLRRSSLHIKLNQKNWEMCWHFWNLHILRWHYEWQWFEWWMQQGRIDMLISFTWSGITIATRVLQPAKIKLSGWQTSKLLEQVVPVAAVHKDVGLQKSFLYPYHSWDVMKPSPGYSGVVSSGVGAGRVGTTSTNLRSVYSQKIQYHFYWKS